jgi:DHA3 family macrolide efflux protein-like MFS transporter
VASGRTMKTFFVVWAGQFVSLVGTNLTGFALAVWVFQETGSTTQLALVLFAGQVPQLVATPFAGALVDRWDRRRAMMISDTGAGVGTLVIAALLLTDSLQIWHLYIALSFSGTFQALQWPAYSAATTLLVDKEHHGRAAGMVQLAEAVGQVIAPALAGVLLLVGGLGLVISVDVLTFLFAVGTLAFVRFPAPKKSEAAVEASGSLWHEARYGWRYIRRRKGLLALLLYFGSVNLVFGFIGVLIFPLVLSFASEAALGTSFSIAGIGMVLGSIVMSAWGGPKRRVFGIFWADVVVGLALVAAAWRPSIVGITAGAFIVFLVIPIGNGSSQALWQAKVEPDLQGRVFAVRRLLAGGTGPVAYLLAGPLADGVFEPLLAPGGALAGSVGSIIGTGPGRGIAFLFMVMGALSIVFTVLAYAYRPLREVQEQLPDVDLSIDESAVTVSEEQAITGVDPAAEPA